MNHEHHERDEHDDAFEHDLRRGLSALAANGPAGPSGDAVIARLHQRTHRRRLAGGAACAAAFAVAVSVIALQRPQSQSVAPPVNHARIEPVTPAQPVTPAPEIAKAPAPTQPREAVASLLNLRQPEVNDPVIPAATQPVEMDWNLTLTLSLASHVSDDAWPSLRFDSPAWR